MYKIVLLKKNNVINKSPNPTTMQPSSYILFLPKSMKTHFVFLNTMLSDMSSGEGVQLRLQATNSRSLKTFSWIGGSFSLTFSMKVEIVRWGSKMK